MSTSHDGTARSKYAARTRKQTRRVIDLLLHS